MLRYVRVLLLVKRESFIKLIEKRQHHLSHTIKILEMLFTENDTKRGLLKLTKNMFTQEEHSFSNHFCGIVAYNMISPKIMRYS